MNEPNIVRWEEPPPRARAVGRVDWTPVAEALRQRPNDWAVLREVTDKRESEDRKLRALAGSIRTGNIRAFGPKGNFQAETRMLGETVLLYARYVGGATQ